MKKDEKGNEGGSAKGSEQGEARKFGTLKGRIKIIDPNWAKPQNDLEVWLKGDV